MTRHTQERQKGQFRCEYCRAHRFHYGLSSIIVQYSSNASQSSSAPFSGTATDGLSSSSSPTSRDLVAATLNHDPRPLPTVAIQRDSTPERSHDNADPFDVIEFPATPPDPAQAPPLEARRNFPTAGTLALVQASRSPLMFPYRTAQTLVIQHRTTLLRP
ncbi:hypothetical protein EI94DRAFT_840795 [Lactarius quietus]|nr:hypothetical protein EI94DRAFT_840795 [Lactarius quietus]